MDYFYNQKKRKYLFTLNSGFSDQEYASKIRDIDIEPHLLQNDPGSILFFLKLPSPGKLASFSIL